ncbi:MAG TPA: hypothetical protein VHX44_12770 [Planctomycetota bacterium]|nr:hypothetical protein [Planctomycetota bacterium]
MSQRHGTVLIIVAGLSALLASLALAFLARQRSSQQETIIYEQDIQARIMMVAACDYISECARIGYDTAIGAEHFEVFGWIDVRDGSVGPNIRGVCASEIVPLFDDTRLVEYWGRSTADRFAWPAQKSVARCPMQVLERPPFAIRLNATPNVMVTDETSPDFGRPYLKNPDPQPQADTRTEFMSVDRRVRQSSAHRAWFRVYREGPATFIITCGAGGTLGYRDWNEVEGAGATATAEFGDPSVFDSLRAQETRLWYRVEWSPGIATAEVHNIKNAWNIGDEDHYVSYPLNTSNSSINPRSQAQCRNQGGTFRYIQRLRMPPTWW